MDGREVFFKKLCGPGGFFSPLCFLLPIHTSHHPNAQHIKNSKGSSSFEIHFNRNEEVRIDLVRPQHDIFSIFATSFSPLQFILL